MGDEFGREAKRAGIGVDEYLDRLDHGLLFCHRCQEFHPAGAFGVNRARLNGIAGSCLRSLREARQTLRQAART